MSATPDSTFTNPEQRIADLERQLPGCKAGRDQGLQAETAAAGCFRSFGYKVRPQRELRHTRLKLAGYSMSGIKSA